MAIDHLELLRAECGRVSHLARVVAHERPLAHLPGWTVHDVLAHLVGDVDWVLATIAERRVPPSGIVASALTGAALCDAWDARAAELFATLSAADANAPCPNFAQGAAGRLGFHTRHQAFETLLHRWDLETATGEHAPIDAGVAADAIDELLATYTVRYSPFALTGTLVLQADDTEATWTITSAARRGFVDTARAPARAAAADAHVSAPAASLLLVLWARTGLDDAAVRVTGDRALARAFLDGPVTA